MTLSTCPRCQSGSYEFLRTHAFCANCNFSPDLEGESEVAIPKWAADLVDTFTVVKTARPLPIRLSFGLTLSGAA